MKNMFFLIFFVNIVVLVIALISFPTNAMLLAQDYLRSRRIIQKRKEKIIGSLSIYDFGREGAVSFPKEEPAWLSLSRDATIRIKSGLASRRRKRKSE